MLNLEGFSSRFKVPLEQTDVTGTACTRFWLKPFCVFAPQGIEHIQFARIGKEQVAVHCTPCTVKCANDPSKRIHEWSGINHIVIARIMELTHDEYLKLLQQNEVCCRQPDDSKMYTSHRNLQVRKMRMHLLISVKPPLFSSFWTIDKFTYHQSEGYGSSPKKRCLWTCQTNSWHRRCE